MQRDDDFEIRFKSGFLYGFYNSDCSNLDTHVIICLIDNANPLIPPSLPDFLFIFVA